MDANSPTFHYTDSDGYKAISSQPDWEFKASQPPGECEFGAYFTTLTLDANRFAARTRIPTKKREYMFLFNGREGLRPVEGGRGEYIFLSPIDYVVVKNRQIHSGPTTEKQ